MFGQISPNKEGMMKKLFFRRSQATEPGAVLGQLRAMNAHH